MPAKKHRAVEPKTSSWVHSTRTHLVMYSFLLVATPFVLLQNFLQNFIGTLSRYSISPGGLEIPVVPVLALVLVAVLAIVFFRHITGKLLLAVTVALLMIALAQQIADFYFDHKFYDLQQNWHYLAYAIFAFMMHRDLAPRGLSSARIMLATFCCAMLFSIFDESFQMFISSRSFDIGDIAKDVWGSLIGIVLLQVGVTGELAGREAWRPVRQPRVRDYLDHPPGLFVLLFGFGLILVNVSSLLSEVDYFLPALLITTGCFAVFAAVFHFSQYRQVKYALLTVLAMALLVQGFFFFRYRNDFVVYNTHGLTVYKGIPIPFFDVMIYPNGLCRPVDKKHVFNYRDRQFMLRRQADILILGSGTRGKGGGGFPQDSVNQFVFNPFSMRGTQVIILPTPQACQEFNRLKREGKNVLFILHSTC